MSRRPSSLAPFSVFDTCRMALRLVADSRTLLLRMGLPALVAAVATGAVLSQATDMNPLRLFIFSLPLYALTAWFLGGAVRHWLLGETPGNPVDDAPTRRALLQASVITFVLWKALVAIYEQLLVYYVDPAALSDPTQLQTNPAVQLPLMMVAGLLFWALRFRLLPVLAAVGYPMKDYAVRASSFMLSFRILGLVLVCVELPSALILTTIASAAKSMPLLIILQQPLRLVLETWLFAAFAVALRQMLGKAK